MDNLFSKTSLLPWGIVPVVAVVGIILTFYRPYGAFLFATLMWGIIPHESNVLVRTPEVSLNLLDIYLGISLAAFWADEKKHTKMWLPIKIRLPIIAITIIGILVLGFYQSLFRYENPYISLRFLRWTISLPIYFILAANMVNNSQRLKKLLWVLLITATVASIQHIIFLVLTRQSINIDTESNLLRNITFLKGQEIWIIVGPFLYARHIVNLPLQISLGILFLISFVAQQTRSIAIGASFTMFVYYAWFLRNSLALKLKQFIPTIIIFALSITLLGLLSFGKVATGYLDRLLDLTSNEVQDISTRKSAIDQETKDWIEGNILFGEGLGYYQRHGFGSRDSSGKEATVGDVGGIAFGHIGHLSYLSNFGVLGFLVFSIWLPFSVIFNARKICNDVKYKPEERYLSAFTGCYFIANLLIIPFFSSGMLSPYTSFPGILGGTIWAIRRFPKETDTGTY